jgi:26S proteasome regulatory subunit N10
LAYELFNRNDFQFIKLAKKLKKEKVNVDFVCFGEANAEDNQILAEFVDTLNGKENNTSSILVIPSGSKLMEALVTSPICRGEGGNMAMIGANGGFEFGVDPDEDPELACKCF